MKKKLVILNTTIMLGLGTFAIPSIKAESQNNLNSIQEQRSSIQASLSKADQELAAVLAEIAKLNEQIKRVDQAIIDNNNMINKTETDIAATKEEVAKLEAEIAVIQDRIDKRNVILKQRALSFQESGGTNVGYIEVLLGASSFSDFVDRVGAVTKIMEADQAILLEHDADKKEVEEKKASIDKKLADLTSMKTELEGMRSQMEEQKKQNDVLKNQLEVKEKETAAKKAELQTEDSKLAAMQVEIQQNIESVQYNSTENSSAAAEKNTNNSGSKKAPASNTNVKANGNINTVISAGYKYIGNSVYVFGGGRTASDIANGRFDCSGFVHWAFSQAGIKVGSSTDSLKNSGTRVPASQMQPGDLVFFDTYKKDGHVGIYIGGGKFIGSQSSTGVAIADMSSGSYWSGVFNGRVVRIQ